MNPILGLMVASSLFAVPFPSPSQASSSPSPATVAGPASAVPPLQGGFPSAPPAQPAPTKSPEAAAAPESSPVDSNPEAEGLAAEGSAPETLPPSNLQDWAVGERRLALADMRAGNYGDAAERLKTILARCHELGADSCSRNTQAVLDRDLGITFAELSQRDAAVASFRRALTNNREIRLPSEFESDATNSAYAEARAQLGNAHTPSATRSTNPSTDPSWTSWAKDDHAHEKERSVNVLVLLDYHAGVGSFMAFGPGGAAFLRSFTQGASLLVGFRLRRSKMFIGPSVEGGVLLVPEIQPAGYVKLDAAFGEIQKAKSVHTFWSLGLGAWIMPDLGAPFIGGELRTGLAESAFELGVSTDLRITSTQGVVLSSLIGSVYLGLRL